MAEITLKQLEVFAAVVEQGGCTCAADELYLAQSTVSAHIAALEDALNTTLLYRENRKKSVPTDTGRIVYTYAKNILSQCEEMKSILLLREPDSLSIGSSSVPSQCIVPNLMSNFLKHCGKCSFLMKTGDTYDVHEMLKHKMVRIGFVGAALDRVNMNYDLLVKDDMVVITANNERFRAMKARGTLGDQLLEERMICREQNSGSRREFEHYLIKKGFPLQNLNIVAQIERSSSIIELVSEGAGISVMSKLVAEQAVNEGKILTFELGDGLQRDIYVATRKDFVPTEREQDFIDFVLER